MRRRELSRRAFFFVTFAVLAILTLVLLNPFISIIVLSLISIIVLKPLYTRLTKWDPIRGRTRLAASLTLIIFLMLIILPTYFLASTTLSQLSQALEEFLLVGFDKSLIGQLSPDIKLQIKRLLSDAVISITQAAISFGVSLISLLMQLMIYVVIFVTLMPEFDSLVSRFEDLSPLGSEISSLYYRKTTAMVSSLARGIFLIAIIQGAMMGFFFWLADIGIWFLLMLLSMVMAMLPVVGISWLTIFVAGGLALSGQTTQAVIVLFGFYGVVNWVDVILRPRLVSKEAYMNFALILLGMLGGIIWAGFLGLFYGPVILLLLVTTIDIYAEKFAKDDGVIIQEYIGEHIADDDPVTDAQENPQSD
jgi:predicted PurR-regulated permease PerM